MSHVLESVLPQAHSCDIHWLESAVRHRLNNRLRNFRLVIVSNGLILYGDVHTFHAKQLAQHTIMEATKLPILANNIVVHS